MVYRGQVSGSGATSGAPRLITISSTRQAAQATNAICSASTRPAAVPPGATTADPANKPAAVTTTAA